MEMLKIWRRTELSHKTTKFSWFQDGCYRHLEFRKSVAISLLLDQSSPNLVEMLKIFDVELIQLLHKNANFLAFKMAVAAILNFENRLPFLHDWTNLYQIWWKCWKSDVELNCNMKMQILSNSSWRPSLSLLSKIGCHFFTIGPILTKFGGNVENLNLTVT